MLDKKYRSSEHIIDAKGKAVLPGFIDAHTHTGQTLFRGEGQDVPEIEWMLKAMGPFGKYTKPEHSIAGSKLGVLEGLKSGVTTFGEIGGNTIPITENVFIPSGVRATIANTVNEIGPSSRPDANKPYIYFPDIGEKKLKDAIELHNKMDKKGDGRINVIFSPHGADFMSKELLFRVKFMLMLATETLYSLRKRSRNARWGRMSLWLEFHIFTGIVGPYMVLLHSAWKFNGLAGIVLLLTVIIVLSGFVGRYIYRQSRAQPMG